MILAKIPDSQSHAQGRREGSKPTGGKHYQIFEKKNTTEMQKTLPSFQKRCHIFEKTLPKCKKNTTNFKKNTTEMQKTLPI